MTEDEFRKGPARYLPSRAEYEALAREYEHAVSALDHMLSEGVSGYWRRRWPEQYRAMEAQLVKHRNRLAMIPGTVAHAARERAHG